MWLKAFYVQSSFIKSILISLHMSWITSIVSPTRDSWLKWLLFFQVKYVAFEWQNCNLYSCCYWSAIDINSYYYYWLSRHQKLRDFIYNLVCVTLCICIQGCFESHFLFFSVRQKSSVWKWLIYLFIPHQVLQSCKSFFGVGVNFSCSPNNKFFKA